MDTKKLLAVGLMVSVVFLGVGSFVVAANGGGGGAGGSSSGLKPEQANECCKLRHDVGDATQDTIVGAPDGHCDLGTINKPTKDWGLYCMIDTIKTVVDWVFYFLIMVVVVMIVIGGFLFATSQGNSEKTKNAKNLITYAVIGLIIALIAKLIPSVTRFIVGL